MLEMHGKKVKMLVTDKKYYMEKALVQNCDFLIHRSKNNWDNVIIIDGDERAGKSTLGRQIGYYIAYVLKKPFSNKNIFFNIDDLIEFARSNESQLIVWDESALGGMSEDRYNKIQQLLIKMLMVCGKYNHTYIFIIPKIRKLADYIAEDRSIALIRVYALDNINRGYFHSYGKKKKNMISYLERRKLSTNHIKRDFRGTFQSYEHIPSKEVIDIIEYDKKKDEAISLLSSQEQQQDKHKINLIKLATYLKKQHKIPFTEMSESMGYKSNYLSILAKNIKI